MSSEKMKITITRALTELKTLDKRIQKGIDSGTFVSYHGQFTKPVPKSKNAAATYQSIMDLLTRRKRLKSLIVMSNAVTTVVICSQEMTVAEAIETKSSIKHYENLINRMKSQYAAATATVEQLNERARRELENKTRIGGDADGTVDIVDFSKKYMMMHGVQVYDPLDVPVKLASLEEYLLQFRGEVDFVLTEKNSTTYIEI